MTTRDADRITDRIRAKKEFVLDSADVFGAGLCPFVETGKQPVRLIVEANGVPVEHDLPAERTDWKTVEEFNTYRWTCVPIPPAALRPGRNEFIIRTAPGQSADLFVEPSVQPNRSARSLDGGQTWDYDVLGVNDSADGEYLVRLYLDRYAPVGRLESEVVDLWGALAPGLAPADPGACSVQMAAREEKPDGTDVGYELRWGKTPAYDPEHWIGWRPLATGDSVSIPERYVQVRASLTTRDPKLTPRLYEIKLTVLTPAWYGNGSHTRPLPQGDGTCEQSPLPLGDGTTELLPLTLAHGTRELLPLPVGEGRGEGVSTEPGASERAMTNSARPSTIPFWKILAADQPKPARSWHRFAYQPYDSKRLKIVRERWGLDRVIDGARGDVELLDRLAAFARHSWEDGWSMGELDYCPPWDALVARELARLNLSLGMCTHYATVFVAACYALGIPARHSILGPHCVAEAWSDDLGKWIMFDAGGDMDDMTKYTYHFERNGVPMNSLEVHRAYLEEAFDEVKCVPPPWGPRATARFNPRSLLPWWQWIFATLREDDLQSLTPGEPEHGLITWGYQFDGYLWWQDDRTPAQPWFSRHTQRDADFNWDLHWTIIHLTSLGEGSLGVALETLPPGLRHFAVRMDGGDWQPRAAEFELELGPGSHRIEARAVNAMGRAGRIASVTVEKRGNLTL